MLLLVLLVLLFGSCTAQNCTTNNLQVTYPAPVAADGWEYRLISTGLTAPRSIVFDSTGGLLVLDAGVGVRRLTLQDNGGTCLSVTANATLIADTAVSNLMSD